MPLLSEHSVDAKPDRQLLQVYDADAYRGSDQALEAAHQDVVGGDGRHAFLHSLQSGIKTTVVIRIWDTLPPAPADADGYVPISIESPTGLLIINEFTMGPAGEAALPQPGLYEGHVSWSGRQATADYFARVLDELDEDPDLDLGVAFRSCPEDERYVFDLALTRHTPPAAS
ncbi:hypothetical protein [Streptomyces sp. NPDC002054]|uniref:hypothetical protein n=1 Tax=Streptomyces sp. NPDC002054 TaxID=3154663 RepID=UPI003326A53B